MNDLNKLTLAIALSAIVLVGWHYFVAGPQMERQRLQASQTAQQITSMK